MMKPSIRKAQIEDIRGIQALINAFAKQDYMLPRSLNELYENIRDFWVCDVKGSVVGCCALHISWDDLAEIKSLAVDTAYQGKHIGRQLITKCLTEARALGARKVFVLTYKPEYFKLLGFKKVAHASLPHKIWAECINCPKFPNCAETALMKSIP